MSSSIQTARELAAQRAAKQAAERQELQATVRAMVYAVVTQTDPPSGDEILSICDRLGGSVDWFDRACENCKRRLDQVAGENQVPDLQAKADALEATATKLADEFEAYKDVALAAFRKVRNPGDRTFSPWRNDATAEEFAAYRETALKHMELGHQHWLAARDAAELRKQIAVLEKIDRQLIDHSCGQPPGKDFALPPLG